MWHTQNAVTPVVFMTVFDPTYSRQYPLSGKITNKGKLLVVANKLDNTGPILNIGN